MTPVADRYDYSLAGPLVMWPQPRGSRRRERPPPVAPVKYRGEPEALLPPPPAIVRLVDNRVEVRTALAMGLSCALAHSLSFLGCAPEQLPVLYLAGPAHVTALDVARAWERHHGVGSTAALRIDPFALSWPLHPGRGATLPLLRRELPEVIARAADAAGATPRLLVIDEMTARPDHGRLWSPRVGIVKGVDQELAGLAHKRGLLVLVVTMNRHEWPAARSVLAVRPAGSGVPRHCLTVWRPAGGPLLPFELARGRHWPVAVPHTVRTTALPDAPRGGLVHAT
jgi:hypothetical protein